MPITTQKESVSLYIKGYLFFKDLLFLESEGSAQYFCQNRETLT